MDQNNLGKSLITIATNNIKYLNVTLIKELKYIFDNNLKWTKKILKTISEDGNISYTHESVG